MAWIFHGAQILGRMAHANPEAADNRGPVWWCDLCTVAASVFVAIGATRQSIERILGPATPWVWAAFLVPYMACFHFLLVGEIRVQTPYDLPSMAFYAICLYAVLARQRLLFYCVFVIATLNRETALFLPLLFFVRQLREDDRLDRVLLRVSPAVIAELLLQLAMWAALRFWSNSLVAPGTFGETRFVPQNIHFLFSPLHWPTLASVFGFLWVPLLLFYRRIPSVFLKRCLLLAPLWLLLMFKYGDLLEIRIHSEWISYVAVCMALMLDRTFALKRQGSPTLHRPSWPLSILERSNTRCINVTSLACIDRLAILVGPFHAKPRFLQSLHNLPRIADRVMNLHRKVVYALQPLCGVGKDRELRSLDIHLHEVDALQTKPVHHLQHRRRGRSVQMVRVAHRIQSRGIMAYRLPTQNALDNGDSRHLLHLQSERVVFVNPRVHTNGTALRTA
jgi:hypothetical protein